ncbi:hypothetical protein [Nostoc sp.]|uniref:hypothetical protein n=1 Tax=Nostoc sp. TaxID=1180 RepID=UPI002FF6DA04
MIFDASFFVTLVFAATASTTSHEFINSLQHCKVKVGAIATSKNARTHTLTNKTNNNVLAYTWFRKFGLFQISGI